MKKTFEVPVILRGRVTVEMEEEDFPDPEAVARAVAALSTKISIKEKSEWNTALVEYMEGELFDDTSLPKNISGISVSASGYSCLDLQDVGSYQEFVRRYIPAEDKDGAIKIHTFDEIKGTDPTHVWSIVDGEYGDTFLSAGYRTVNATGEYVATKRPWTEDEHGVPDDYVFGGKFLDD